jgi:Na+-transporting methylmalonyl-CoA/oxaloacetate decarboxylase gamma subunit
MITAIIVFSFLSILAYNIETTPKNIDNEIRQEYINSHKQGGYYYYKNLERAKKEVESN